MVKCQLMGHHGAGFQSAGRNRIGANIPGQSASLVRQNGAGSPDAGGNPASRFSLLSFRRFDPARLDSSGLTGDQPHHVQIGRGPVEGQADQYYFDSCALRIGSLSNIVRVSVQFPADRVTIGLALEAPRSIRILGRALAASDLTVFGPAEAADVLFDAGAKWVSFNLPSAEYVLEVAAITENPDLLRPRNAPLFRPTAQSADGLRQKLADLAMIAAGQAELFADARWRANVERCLRAGFFSLLEEATLLERGRGETRLRSARSIVQAAEAWVDSEDEPIPSIARLCSALRASRRTVERAFREVVGLSPATYFRIRALNAVRRDLLDIEPEPGAVARLAVDKGFWHLGRFSQAYRALFGERPVDTLRGRGRAG